MAGAKLDQAIRAGNSLLDDDRLSPEDQVAVIHFDDAAETLFPLGRLGDGKAAHDAVNSLRKYSGGTHMAKGMLRAREAFRGLPAETAKRVILLTDGQTFDEPECPPLAAELGKGNTPVIAIGIGEEYNEELMMGIAQVSQGRPYHLEDMKQLRDILDVEVGSSVSEVVTDLQASVSTVKSVTLDSLARIYPSLSEVSLSAEPYRLGNIAAKDYTVFVLEFTVAGIERPPSRARVARVGLAGHVPGLNRRDELPPEDLFVAFTPDEAAVAAVDPEVLGYVQQKNGVAIINNAVAEAARDPEKAKRTLQVAIGMTQKVGNAGMTQVLEHALDELNKTGTISVGTRKTLSVGGRTKTVKPGGTTAMDGVPSEEQIRKLTGA